MSCGLTSDNGLVTPLTPVWSIATPSITINGLLDAFKDEPPRIRIVEPAPGVPPSFVTLTPATLPESISCALTTSPLFFPSGFRAVTEPVKSLFLTAPYPITTTSFIC